MLHKFSDLIDNDYSLISLQRQGGVMRLNHFCQFQNRGAVVTFRGATYLCQRVNHSFWCECMETTGKNCNCFSFYDDCMIPKAKVFLSRRVKQSQRKLVLCCSQPIHLSVVRSDPWEVRGGTSMHYCATVLFHTGQGCK